MNSATYKRPFKAVASSVVSQEALRAAAGQQMLAGSPGDGPSGGPMSTTSNNALNPGEWALGRRLAALGALLAAPSAWWPALRRQAAQCCALGELGPIELDSL